MFDNRADDGFVVLSSPSIQHSQQAVSKNLSLCFLSSFVVAGFIACVYEGVSSLSFFLRYCRVFFRVDGLKFGQRRHLFFC